MFTCGPGLFRSGPIVYPTQTQWSTTNKASDIVLSGGGYAAASNSPSGGGTVLSVSAITHKVYAEFIINKIYSTTPGSGFGIHIGTSSLSTYLGGDASGWGAWSQSDDYGRVFFNSGSSSFVQASRHASVGSVGRLAFDPSTGALWMAYFGFSSWLSAGVPDPATGANPTFTLSTGSSFYLALCPRRGDSTNALNRNEIQLVAPASWVYGAPSGFGVLS